MRRAQPRVSFVAMSGTYRPAASAAPPSAKACLFVGDRLVLGKAATSLPSVGEAEAWIGGEPGRDQPRRGVRWFPVQRASRGSAGAGGAPGPPAVAGVVGSPWTPPDGAVAVGLRTTLGLLAEPDLSLALTAAHLARWRRTSRYCGVCGGATAPASRHRAMACSACGHLAFPRVSPAVIVQVTRGPRILLGRSRRHPPGSYSVLAGFVDPGESLEDAVRREVREESGVRVTNVRYFGSQPWPFPDSLMVAFTAVSEPDGGPPVPGDDELEDVAWFRADALPPVPPAYSIARALIDDFARRHGVDPATAPTWKRRPPRG